MIYVPLSIFIGIIVAVCAGLVWMEWREWRGEDITEDLD